MAAFSLVNSTIWVHDQDLSGVTNKVKVSVDTAELDVTTFGSGGYKQKLGGLKMAMVDVSGFYGAQQPDSSLFSALGALDRVATISPEGVAAKTAYLMLADEFNYEAFGSVDAVAPFAAVLKSSNKIGVVRGQLAAASGVISATGAFGAVLNLGPVGSSQFLYAALHVFSPGTTITVIVESAPAANFAAPTTRGTLGPITLAGGTWLVRVAGPITDGYYRLNASAITGAFTLGGAIAVG